MTYISDNQSLITPIDEVGGRNESCFLLSSFVTKKARIEAEYAFDFHILAPVKQ